MEQKDLLKQFVSISLKKPMSYFVSYKVQINDNSLLDVVLITLHNEEYHFIITKDLKAYCFKFMRNSNVLVRVYFALGQQVKKTLLQLRQIQNKNTKSSASTNSVLKRKLFLNQQLEMNVNIENYTKCAELHKLLLSVS